MKEIKVPELAESITEGTIAKWLVNKGDYVNKGDNVVELETDKVNLEISAEDAGVIQELKKEPGDTVEVDEVIAWIDENASPGEEKTSQEEGPPSAKKKEGTARADEDQHQENKQEDKKEEEFSTDTVEKEGKTVPAPEARLIATPAARKLARERGIDLNQVQTRDPMGRVRVEDLKEPFAPPRSEGVPKSDADSEKPIERRRMSRRRQTIANRLVDAQHTAAMLTTFNEVDMTAILDIRKRRKEAFLKQHNIKLGFMSFFTKAAVGALKAFPLLNAEIQDEDILVKKFYDIGIAVSAKEGLVVPVVRHADQLSFADIEREIGALARKARENKLSLSDIQGGTFTITNGGIFGSLLSTPILNGPQVGILGMHKIQMRPVAIDDTRMENRPMMYVALSYDHRIVDGAEAVSFLVKMKELLEDPTLLLLED